MRRTMTGDGDELVLDEGPEAVDVGPLPSSLSSMCPKAASASTADATKRPGATGPIHQDDAHGGDE